MPFLFDFHNCPFRPLHCSLCYYLQLVFLCQFPSMRLFTFNDAGKSIGEVTRYTLLQNWNQKTPFVSRFHSAYHTWEQTQVRIGILWGLQSAMFVYQNVVIAFLDRSVQRNCLKIKEKTKDISSNSLVKWVGFCNSRCLCSTTYVTYCSVAVQKLQWSSESRHANFFG